MITPQEKRKTLSEKKIILKIATSGFLACLAGADVLNIIARICYYRYVDVGPPKSDDSRYGRS